MKYEVGDVVYFKGKKFCVMFTCKNNFGEMLLTLSGKNGLVRGLINEHPVKRVVFKYAQLGDKL